MHNLKTNRSAERITLIIFLFLSFILAMIFENKKMKDGKGREERGHFNSIDSLCTMASHLFPFEVYMIDRKVLCYSLTDLGKLYT